MKKFKFNKKNFADFTTSSDYNDVDGIIKRGFQIMKDKFEKGDKEPCFVISIGNTLVTGHAYLVKGGTYDVIVHVARNFQEASESNVDLEKLLSE